MNERTVHAIEIIRNWMVMNQYNTEESESSGNRDQMDFYGSIIIFVGFRVSDIFSSAFIHNL